MEKNKRTIHVFGENVIDLEGKIKSLPKGSNVNSDGISIPLYTALKVLDSRDASDMRVYLGLLSHTDAHGHSIAMSGSMNLKPDMKYDIKGGLEFMINASHESNWMHTFGINHFAEIAVTNRNGGGGAHNCAYNMQDYINSDDSLDLAVELVVPHGSSLVQSNLPAGLIYSPIFGIDDALVPKNVTVTTSYGRKITFRSKTPERMEYPLKDDVKGSDILVVDSIKSSGYLDSVKALSDCGAELYVAMTDSMITQLGVDEAYNLAVKSELYISNDEEFELLMKGATKGNKSPISNINDETSLVSALYTLHDDRLRAKGKAGNICITLGDKGSIICDSNREIYYQPVSKGITRSPYIASSTIVNTSGCGDSYFAMAVIGTAMHWPADMLLERANASGHLCAFENSTTVPGMITYPKIEGYLKDFSTPPLHRYDLKTRRFERCM